MKKITRRISSVFFAMVLILATFGSGIVLAEDTLPSFSDFVGTSLGTDSGEFTWLASAGSGYSIDSVTGTLNGVVDPAFTLATLGALKYELSGLTPSTTYTLEIDVDYSKSEQRSFTIEKIVTPTTENFTVEDIVIWGRREWRWAGLFFLPGNYVYALKTNHNATLYNSLADALAAKYPELPALSAPTIYENYGVGWEKHEFDATYSVTTDVTTYKVGDTSYATEGEAITAVEALIAGLAGEFDEVSAPTVSGFVNNINTYTVTVTNRCDFHAETSFTTEDPVDENPDDETPDDETPDDETPDDENPDDETPDDDDQIPEENPNPTPDPTPAPTAVEAPVTTYILTVNVQGEGTVPGFQGSNSFSAGTNVNMGPVAGEGFEFVGWTGDTASLTGNTVVMTGNITLTAVFEAIQEEVVEEIVEELVPEELVVEDEVIAQELVVAEEPEVAEDAILDEEIAQEVGITALPDTGGIPVELFTLAGSALAGLGVVIKKRK